MRKENPQSHQLTDPDGTQYNPGSDGFPTEFYRVF
jgi:hypothetical protein